MAAFPAGKSAASGFFATVAPDEPAATTIADVPSVAAGGIEQREGAYRSTDRASGSRGGSPQDGGLKHCSPLRARGG